MSSDLGRDASQWQTVSTSRLQHPAWRIEGENDGRMEEKKRLLSMMINIPKDVAKRLEALAAQEGSTISALLITLLDRYAPESAAGSLAEMAENAREAGLASAQSVDTAERSREILNTEYADYLKRRMDKGADGNHNG